MRPYPNKRTSCTRFFFCVPLGVIRTTYITYIEDCLRETKGKERFCRPLRLRQNFILASPVFELRSFISFHSHLVLHLVLEFQRRPSRSLFWVWMI